MAYNETVASANHVLGAQLGASPATKTTMLESVAKEYGASLEHLIEQVKRIDRFRERMAGSQPENPTPVEDKARLNNGAIGSLNVYNEILRTQTTSLAVLAAQLEAIA